MKYCVRATSALNCSLWGWSFAVLSLVYPCGKIYGPIINSALIQFLLVVVLMLLYQQIFRNNNSDLSYCLPVHNINELNTDLTVFSHVVWPQGDDDLLTVYIGEIFLEFVNMLPAFQTYCLQQSTSVNMLNTLEKEKELLRYFFQPAWWKCYLGNFLQFLPRLFCIIRNGKDSALSLIQKTFYFESRAAMIHIFVTEPQLILE